MIEVVQYEPAHLRRMALQQQQREVSGWLKDGYAEALATAPGLSYAVLRGEEVLACAGLHQVWAGRVVAWALLAEHLGTAFIYLHSAVKRCLEIAPAHRIEAYVDCEFTTGAKWVERLGFEREGRMRAFGIDRRDFYLYSMVR